MALAPGAGFLPSPIARFRPDPISLPLPPATGIPTDVRLGFKRPVNPIGSLPGGPVGIPQPPSPNSDPALAAQMIAAQQAMQAQLAQHPSNPFPQASPALEQQYALNLDHALAQAAGGGSPVHLPEQPLGGTIGQGPGSDFAPHRPVFMGRPAQTKLYPQIRSLSHLLSHAAAGHRSGPLHDLAQGT